MAAKVLTFEQGKEGMRVQDYWGCTGTIRWKGKLGKNDKPPNGTPGHYFFIEYDEESDNPLRTDGTWSGKRYVQCDARKGMMCRAHNFLLEVNPMAVQMLREKFGEKVASWHDVELIKFCIARQFDMPKVFAMLESHLQWRESFRPSADEYFPPSMAKDYPCGYSGNTDYDGNLIYCERPGNGGLCAPGDFVQRYTLPRIARWHACGVEMAILRMRATQYRSKRMCYIVDLLKVNAMSRPMIGFAQTLAKVEQDNYPENLGRCFIVNCPTVFRLAWRLVKVFIDERTNKKISFLSPGKAVEAMKECMKEEYIPDFAGGQCSSWLSSNDGRLGSSDPSKEYTDQLEAEFSPMLSDADIEKLESDTKNDGSESPKALGASLSCPNLTPTECATSKSLGNLPASVTSTR